MDSEWNEILSEPILCLLSHCKDFVKVNILPLRTHESIDQGWAIRRFLVLVSTQIQSVVAP